MTIRTLPLGAAAVALTAAALFAGFGCKSSRETARTDQAGRDRTAARPVEPARREPTKIEEKIAETTVEYKGRKIPAVRSEVFEDGKLQKTVWTSPEVPLEGVVEIENAEGQVVRRLMDYGRGGNR
jgi:hypothetical protein